MAERKSNIKRQAGGPAQQARQKGGYASRFSGNSFSPSGNRGHRFTESFGFEEADNRLHDVFRNHGLQDIDHTLRRKFTQYYFELVEIQKKENLTRLLTLRDVGLKHFVDCVLVDRLVKLSFPLLDIGTGAGFPGVVLKLLHPEERIVLAEPVKRRVEFLKSLRTNLKLENLDVVGRKIDATFELPMACAITRALEKIDLVLAQVKNCLPPGARMIFMKGPSVEEELQLALKTSSEHFKLVEDQHYELPKSPHKRRLLVFERRK